MVIQVVCKQHVINYKAGGLHKFPNVIESLKELSCNKTWEKWGEYFFSNL